MAASSSSAPVVRLNVGGVEYATSATSLAAVPGSLLARMFAPENASLVQVMARDELGRVFIDRDGQLFKFVLNYVRNGCLLLDVEPNAFLLRALRAEADFFALDGMVAECNALLADLEREKELQLERERKFLAATHRISLLRSPSSSSAAASGSGTTTTSMSAAKKHKLCAAQSQLAPLEFQRLGNDVFRKSLDF